MDLGKPGLLLLIRTSIKKFFMTPLQQNETYRKVHENVLRQLARCTDTKHVLLKNPKRICTQREDSEKKAQEKGIVNTDTHPKTLMKTVIEIESFLVVMYFAK